MFIATVADAKVRETERNLPTSKVPNPTQEVDADP